MLVVNQLIGFGAQSGPSGVVFVDAKLASSATGATTYSDLNPGLVGSFSHVLLLVGARANTGSRTISSFTVNGSAASYQGRQGNGSQWTEIWSIASSVCSDCDITWDGAMANMGLTAVAVTGLQSLTFVDDAASNSDPAALTIDHPAGGITVGVAYNATTGTQTWANATSIHDTTIGSFRTSAAYYASETANPSRAVECDYASFNLGCAMARSFR